MLSERQFLVVNCRGRPAEGRTHTQPFTVPLLLSLSDRSFMGLENRRRASRAAITGMRQRLIFTSAALVSEQARMPLRPRASGATCKIMTDAREQLERILNVKAYGAVVATRRMMIVPDVLRPFSPLRLVQYSPRRSPFDIT